VQYTARIDEAGRSYLLLANTSKSKAAAIQIKGLPGRELALLRHAERHTVENQTGEIEIPLDPLDAATLIISNAR